MVTTEYEDPLIIAGKSFGSRLFAGTGKFGSLETMQSTLRASESELVTVALKRVDTTSVSNQKNILDYLRGEAYSLLPNTSGVRTAKEAVFAAELAREALGTNWLKLEIHPDPKYLMPDPIETLEAAEQLVKLGFVVLPYVNADPVLCKRLEDVGTAAVMPLGSAIGSNKGLMTRDMLEIIIDQATVPVVIDAGIGSPSDAALAMEIGADAVLINTAMAVNEHPERMAIAFRRAVQAGRDSYIYNNKIQSSHTAIPSSPLTGFLDL